jgi:hypothetical protein
MTVNFYEQYFSAECVFNGVLRKAALVMLISDSEAGRIRYEAAVTFFPHREENDYSVCYDAYASSLLYEAPGRRSRKREKLFLEQIRELVDPLAESMGGIIHWDRPLREARLG